VAILDPELTLTQPRGVTACTGIDALAHAVETAVCRKRTEISGHYSRVAFQLLDRGFESVLQQPDDLEARARMQLGAAFAGTAIENSMLGAAHSTANPLTARYGTIHGRAVGLMLPHVVAMNRRDAESNAIYDQVAARFRRAVAGAPRPWLSCPGEGELGVREEEIPSLAAGGGQAMDRSIQPGGP